MKILLIVVIGLLLFATVRMLLYSKKSREGEPIGLVHEQLAKCPLKKNCVSSELEESSQYKVEPLAFTDLEGQQSWIRLRNILIDLGGVISRDDGQYMALTFTSQILGFVDDVECRLDKTHKKVRIRSASRVGYYDFSANRNRIERIRQIFDNLEFTE